MLLMFLAAMAGAESTLALVLLSNVSPMVQLGHSMVEMCKSNRGLVVVQTLSAACLAFFALDLRSILRIQRRGAALADQLALPWQILEMTLIGYCLLLELIVSSLHSSLKKVEGLVSSLHSSLKKVEGLTCDVDMLKKQGEGAQVEYMQLQGEKNLKSVKEDEVLVAELRSLKGIISDLRNKLEQLQVEKNSKEKELNSAKANLNALEKQSQGFQNEYSRLMDNNESLRIQLSLFDRKYANSSIKKYS